MACAAVTLMVCAPPRIIGQFMHIAIKIDTIEGYNSQKPACKSTDMAEYNTSLTQRPNLAV